MSKRASKKRLAVSVISALLSLAIVALVTFGRDSLSKFLNNVSNPLKLDFDTSQDFVRFLSVGQGDSILIYSNGRSMLLDTSTAEYQNEICAALNSCGITDIDLLMISHLHTDHTGSVQRICDDYGVKNLVLPELSVYSEGMSAAQYAVNAVTKSGGGVYNAEQGLNFKLGEFEITVLASYGDFEDENNQSLFVMAQIGGKRFMFSGDAEAVAEKRLLKEGLNLDCDVFKADHHGSSTSNTKAFLEAMSPKYAVISCGKDNMYGHPHDEVMSRFDKMHITPYRTDLQGDITFYVDDGKISIKNSNT